MTTLNPEPKQENVKSTQQTESKVAETNTDSNLQQQNGENQPQSGENKEQDSSQDTNWRVFREGRKKDRAEKEAAERRAAEKEAEAAALKAAMEAAFSKSAPTTQAYEQYYGMNQSNDADETEEQRLEKKINQIIAQKEKQYAKEQADREMREYPTRLTRELPDFNNICSQENLDYLDFHFPEISRPLQRLQDGYDKWHDIYYAVKKLIPNHSTSKKEALRAEINSNKPKSISSSGPSPTGDKPRESWQESERKKAENWARMQRTLKGV